VFPGQDLSISFPEVTIRKCNCDNLSGSTAHNSPKPALIDLLDYKTPGFIIFQDIIWLGWQQSVFEFWLAYYKVYDAA
jgi:hypothetical protein